MNRDMLSQDEIDALLRQNNLADEEESTGDLSLDQYLTPFDQDALGEIGNISFGSASTALSTLLGQKVEITTPTIRAVLRKNVEKEFPSPHVAVHVEYKDGFQGINLFVLKTDDAKVIADLMLGGNGEGVDNKDLSDMDISAVQEAMNQMMGSAATSMSTIFNTPVNISPPGVNILDIKSGKGDENLPKENVIILVSFKLTVGNLIDSNIMQLTSVSFAKEMINKLLGTPEEELVKEDPKKEPEVINKAVVEEKKTPTPPPVDEMYQPVNQTMGQMPESMNNYSHSNVKGNQFNQNINVQQAQFADFSSPQFAQSHDPNMGLLMDIPLQITVELGRTKKLIKDILELSQGSVIELDKLAGEPVDIFANQKLIAKGEVVVIDENFGVRVTDIISPYERVRKLQ